MKNVSMLVCQIFKFWLSDDFYPYILNSHFPQNAFYTCIEPIYTSILIISQCTCKIANVKCWFNMTQLKSTHMCLVNDKKKFLKNLINIIIFYFVCLANWTVFFLPTTIFFFTQTSICQTDKLCAKQKRLVFSNVTT